MSISRFGTNFQFLTEMPLYLHVYSKVRISIRFHFLIPCIIEFRPFFISKSNSSSSPRSVPAEFNSQAPSTRLRHKAACISAVVLSSDGLSSKKKHNSTAVQLFGVHHNIGLRSSLLSPLVGHAESALRRPALL